MDYLIKEIRFQIIQFESSSWKNFVEKQGANPMSTKPWWKRINRFRKKRNNGIPTLVVNNKELKTDIEKANRFGEKLFKTFNEDPEDIHLFNNSHKTKIDSYINSSEFIKNCPNNFTKITVTEIKKAIKSYKNKDTPDEDLIISSCLKHLPENILDLLCEIFKISIRNSVIPTRWKESRITIIEKKAINLT